MAFDNTNFLESDPAVEADFTFTNKNGTVNSGLQARNTQLNWCLETNGGTTSSGTGPSANPVGRTAYVYTESSETGTPASSVWAMRRSITFDNTTQNVFLDIIHNLNCDVGSEYYVEYATVPTPNETTDWTILQTVPCNATDAWVAVTYDFSAVPQTTTLHIRIRFSHTAAFTNDLAFSTWREYGIDTVSPGSGMILTTSDINQSLAGLMDPPSYNYELSRDWAALTLALRLKSGLTGDSNFSAGSKFNGITTSGSITVRNGATINNRILTGNVILDEVIDISGTQINGNLSLSLAGSYNFTDVVVTGDVLNLDASGNATINLSGNSSVSTTEPGTGNGLVNIVNVVFVSVTALDAVTSIGISNATIRLVADSGGDLPAGTVILNGVSDINGLLENLTFNYSSDQPVTGYARKASGSPYYKQGVISGTITNSGLTTSAFLILDE